MQLVIVLCSRPPVRDAASEPGAGIGTCPCR